MDFFDVINQRRSVRVFGVAPVEEDKLNKILEAANRAPSAGNLQAYEIYIVREKEQRQALAKAALDQEFVAQAPVVLVFCSHGARSEKRYKKRGVNLYAIQDATIACSFAMLAATALGLGSVWVGAFDQEAVQQVIGARQGVIPLALLPVGYPKEDPEWQSRRLLTDLVHGVE